MNSNNDTRKSWLSLFRPLPFRFMVREPLAKCAELLQSKHELHVIGPSHYVKIEASTEKILRFSINQPRRLLSIRATGTLTAIPDDATEIMGEISADFMTFYLVGVFAVIVVGIALLSASSGAFCFGPLLLLILGIGATIELIGLYYARLGLFTFLKRSFE